MAKASRKHNCNVRFRPFELPTTSHHQAHVAHTNYRVRHSGGISLKNSVLVCEEEASVPETYDESCLIDDYAEDPSLFRDDLFFTSQQDSESFCQPEQDEDVQTLPLQLPSTQRKRYTSASYSYLLR